MFRLFSKPTYAHAMRLVHAGIKELKASRDRHNACATQHAITASRHDHWKTVEQEAAARCQEAIHNLTVVQGNCNEVSED